MRVVQGGLEDRLDQAMAGLSATRAIRRTARAYSQSGWARTIGCPGAGAPATAGRVAWTLWFRIKEYFSGSTSLEDSLITRPVSSKKVTRSSKTTVIYLGTMAKIRKIDFLIKIFKQVIDSQDNIDFLMVGDSEDPNDLEYLKDFANKLGIPFFHPRLFWVVCPMCANKP